MATKARTSELSAATLEASAVFVTWSETSAVSAKVVSSTSDRLAANTSNKSEERPRGRGTEGTDMLPPG